MRIDELKEEIENIFYDLPQEAQEYINYLEDKNSAYFRLIVDTKRNLFHKEYNETEKKLSYIIFNGINVQGYEQ
jgi:hypothetical protein